MEVRGQPWFETFVTQGRYADELARIPSEQSEAEVAFIIDALGIPPGGHVLDLACGVGRHAVILASRGYRVAGIDLDPAALEIAVARANEAHVEIAFRQTDMREIPFEGELDAVISIFSSFGYYDSDGADMDVLTAVANALRSGGRLFLDLMNRERVFRDYSERDWHAQTDGTIVLTKRELDLRTSRHTVKEVLLHADGGRSERWHTFRFYTLGELTHGLSVAGLKVAATWGGFDGSPYQLKSRRMIILAEKAAT